MRLNRTAVNPWLGVGGVAATGGIALSLILAASPIEPSSQPADPAADAVPQVEDAEPLASAPEEGDAPTAKEQRPDEPSAPRPEANEDSESSSDPQAAPEESEEIELPSCVGEAYDVVADAFVQDGDQAGTNYGSDRLEVAFPEAEQANRISYLKFDVAGLRECDDVKNVSLRLMGQVPDSEESTTVGVHSAGSEWDEDSITWNDKPELDEAIQDFSVTGSTEQWYTIDVTEYVLSSDTDEVTLALYSPQDGSPNLATAFSDRESENGAQLTAE